MDKLKLAIKLAKAPTPAEKALLSLYSETSLNTSIDKSVDSLIDSLSQEQHFQDNSSSYQAFVKYLKKCKSWKPAVNLLFATHQVIHKIGASFCTAFTDEEFENIRNFSKTKPGIDYIYEVMTANYYSFLVCYANCFEDIQTLSRNRLPETIEAIQDNDTAYLSKLLALKELVQYVTKIESSIRASLKPQKYKTLFEKITAKIISDTITANNIINEALDASKHLIFKLQPENALMLDELYSDTIQNTKKLQPFLEGLNLPDNLYVPPVRYFEFDPEFNKQEELFILGLKKEGHAKLRRTQTSKPKEKIYTRTYTAPADDKEIISPSEVKYSNYQEVMIKPKERSGVSVQKRSPLQEKMRNSELYNQIELVSPEPKDKSNLLKVDAYSPGLSSPGSAENLMSPGLLRNLDGKGRNRNLPNLGNGKATSMLKNGNMRNNDTSPSDLFN